jgi:hypothetical protein
MDDNGNNQNQMMQGAQDPNNPVQLNDAQNQSQQQAQVSVGGSPEVASVEVKTGTDSANSAEVQSSLESGYEQIKAIEKAVEKQAEKAEKPQHIETQQKQQKNEDKREKKEVPVTVKPKFFGYKPSKKIANDPNYIKSHAGRGDKQDSKTWLLVFLDRLLKKESS